MARDFNNQYLSNMKKILFVISMGVMNVTAFAQDKTMVEFAQSAKDNKDGHTKGNWTTGGLISLNIAQGSSQNWAAGAEKFSLSLNAFTNVFANRKWGKNTWGNNLDLAYGLVNTTSQGIRKNDDRIDFFSKYTFQLKPKFSLGAVFNFRSQFSDGYDFGETPKRRISDWFAPAYITVSPGVEWKPAPYFSIFASPVAARFVIVSNDPYSYQYPGGTRPDGTREKPLAAGYGVDTLDKVDFQLGAFVSANFNKEIAKNITYKSRLDLYSNYRHNPQNIDVNWTNVLVMKVNKWINVTYNFDLIYDDDIKQFGPDLNAPRTQIRSLLGVGLATKL